MTTTYDVIIAGTGAMGSATAWQLARRGKRVLALDRFDVPNAMGSSHGVHRIIRLAYFEHPSYVPMLRRAYELWRDTEQQGGEQLLHITGSLDIGPPGAATVEGSLASCREHGLVHELLSAAEVARRHPGYRLPSDFQAVFQPDGGFVASERAVAAAARLARAAGATLRTHDPLLAFEPLPGGGVRVRAESGTYEAGRLVLATGAWIGEHVAALKTLAVPERQVLGWFRPKTPEHFRLENFPVSNLTGDVGRFYQFPVWGTPEGFKIGRYHHFEESGAADALSREPTPRDEAALREALRHYFPEADGEILAMKMCLFTNTPDRHFILDRLPGFPEVIVASPCSGHGFKFASVIGEILSMMALGETPPFDLSLFRLDRFATPSR